MKVYMVTGTACGSYKGGDAAMFASRDSAEEYIREQLEGFVKDSARLYELDLWYDIRTLSSAEEEERRAIRKRWWYGTTRYPEYRIEEYEVKE